MCPIYILPLICLQYIKKCLAIHPLGIAPHCMPRINKKNIKHKKELMQFQLKQMLMQLLF